MLALLVLAAALTRAQTPALPPDTVHVSKAAYRAQLIADTVYAHAHYNRLVAAYYQ